MMYVIGGVAVLILIGMAATGASGMTVSSYPVPGGPQSKFADAIAHAEGFYVSGSRPARNHNPGDLENWPGVPTDGEGYSVFASDSDGWQALEQQLNAIRNSASRHYSSGMSFAAMGFIYAGGDPGGNWARNVASFLGANVSDPIGDWL